MNFGAVLAILFLVLVSVALVCVGFYALFGRPSSSHGKKRRQEVINGFQLAAGLLLGCALMGTLVFAVGYALGDIPTPHVGSRILAGVTAVSTLAVIALMVQRWAKHFAGWIAWGIYNSLFMASSGHLLNNPTVPVRRSFAYTMAALCFLTVVFSRRFTKNYTLNMGEKIALLLWIAGFGIGANAERVSIPALAVGTGALGIMWWLCRSRARHRRHHHPDHEAMTKPPAGLLGNP